MPSPWHSTLPLPTWMIATSTLRCHSPISVQFSTPSTHPRLASHVVIGPWTFLLTDRSLLGLTTTLSQPSYWTQGSVLSPLLYAFSPISVQLQNQFTDTTVVEAAPARLVCWQPPGPQHLEDRKAHLGLPMGHEKPHTQNPIYSVGLC